MAMLLLSIIYLTFIGLGLPDALLGAAWPVMHVQIGADFSLAGIITMIMASGTIIAGIVSNRITKKLGTCIATVVGVCMSSIALFGMASSTAFWMICLFAVPYGLGAGTIDVALNNYVAIKYSSRSMSWLHAFWGLGALISPYIMGFALVRNLGWETGYITVSLIQVGIIVILLSSLPLWKKMSATGVAGQASAGRGNLEQGESGQEKAGQIETGKAESSQRVLSLKEVLRIRGVKIILPAFFAYCTVEASVMLWGVSYLVAYRGIPEEIAAGFGALFFWGMMTGRFLGGFIANKVGDRGMIRGSICVIVCAITLLLLPFQSDFFSLAGLLILGLGCATVFPSIIHSTPQNFGEHNAPAIIGVQMAGAYTGTTLMPMLFGLLTRLTGIWIFPVFILVFTLLALFLMELFNKTIDKGRKCNA